MISCWICNCFLCYKNCNLLGQLLLLLYFRSLCNSSNCFEMLSFNWYHSHFYLVTFIFPFDVCVSAQVSYVYYIYIYIHIKDYTVKNIFHSCIIYLFFSCFYRCDYLFNHLNSLISSFKFIFLLNYLLVCCSEYI